MKTISRKDFASKTMARLCSFYLALAALETMAVPANPKPATVEQPTGQVIQVYLKGDEFLHWHEDSKGYTILHDSAKNRWVYAMKNASGKLEPSAAVVGQDDPAQMALPKHLLPDGAVGRSEALRRMQHKTPAVPNTESEQARLPRTGTMANLVLLVEFSDLAHTRTKEEFEALFNSTDYTVDGAAGSVKEYYDEVSYHALNVDSVVVDWITLDNGYAYYGANDIFGWDLRPREMVSEALAKLEARGFDFSVLDSDNDGYVDGLTVIHAGGGEEYSGNNASYIWSHKWQMISSVTYDGKTLHQYHTEPERRGWDTSPSTQGITRIGVICHENGHFLGLPDLYDYDYDSTGAGYFCLMAGGSWNGNDGTQPAHMNAWCKKTLTWLSSAVVTGPGTYAVPQIEDHPTAFQLNGAFPSTQYFLVENRQGHGFDASLPGSTRGLLIWHVDETQPNNDDQTHYKVDLEEASGIQHLELNQNSGNDADYFRQGNATLFTSGTTPDNRSYSDVALGLDLVAVSASGSNMTFAVNNVGAPSSLTATATSSSRIDLSWGKNSNGDNVMLAFNTSDTFGMPTNGTTYGAGSALGPATVLYNGAATTFSHMTLLQGTRYYYQAWSVDGSGAYSTPLSTASSTFAEFPNTESFETGFGAWINADGDDGEWTRNSGPTSSSLTGPSGAHDGSYYLYTEASSGASPGFPAKSAFLEATFDFTGVALPGLAFHYHMYGATMGTLYVDVFDGNWHLGVWSRSGQQQASSSDAWAQATVDLSDYANTSNVKLRFRGITGSSYTSDMAIDYIQLYELLPPGEIDVQDSVAPADNLAIPFGEVVAGGARTEQITVVNLDATHELELADIRIIAGGSITPIHVPAFKGEFEHDTHPPSIGRAPAAITLNTGRSFAAAAPSDAPCYGIEMVAKQLVSFSTSTPGSQTAIASSGANLIPSVDFPGGDFTTLYALDSIGNVLIRIDTATGNRTIVGVATPSAGQTWTGLSGDPTDGTLYASSTDISTSKLYWIDVLAGTATEIGNITGAPGIIDIAVDSDGAMYGIDIVNDNLISINTSTGAGTVVGSLGVDSNYAQGMDFDEANNILYWAAYTTSAELRVIDTATGASTLADPFPASTELCIAVAHGNVSPYALESLPALPSTIPPLGRISFNVVFAPSEEGSALARVIIENNDTDESTVEVALSGTGMADTDGDGIPDWWETVYFGHPSNCVATVDWDFDGHNNKQEYISGMNPTDPNSCFMVTNCIPLTGSVHFVVEWNSVSGRVYSALWSTNLMGSFQPLETGIEYPRNSSTDTVHSAEDAGFYKVEVQLK